MIDDRSMEQRELTKRKKRGRQHKSTAAAGTTAHAHRKTKNKISPNSTDTARRTRSVSRISQASQEEVEARKSPTRPNTRTIGPLTHSISFLSFSEQHRASVPRSSSSSHASHISHASHTALTHPVKLASETRTGQVWGMPSHTNRTEPTARMGWCGCGGALRCVADRRVSATSPTPHNAGLGKMKRAASSHPTWFFLLLLSVCVIR
jgi:hypothetical protein